MTGNSPLGSVKDRKVRYNRGEQKLANKVGGRRQPGSGAIDGFKGDVITREFLIDQKTTEHASYRLTAGVLNKITFEARQAGKHPAIEIELSAAPSTPKEWMLIPLEVFNEYRKLSDAIEKGEVPKKEDKETGSEDGGNQGGDSRDSTRAGTVTGGTPEEEILEIEEAGKAPLEKEKEGDARIGVTCYNDERGTGGIRFGF